MNDIISIVNQFDFKGDFKEVQEFGSGYINKTYLASGRNCFSQIIDSFVTDISIVDFSRCERTLSAMAAGDIKYTSVSSAGGLTVTPGKRGK